MTARPSYTQASLTGALVLTESWRARPSDGERWGQLAAAGALFGLAFSSHHISAVLVLPALCWHAAAGARSAAAFVQSLAVPALASLPVALAFYFSILWISSSGPVMNWGGVKDLQTLYWHVSGKMYSVNFKWPSDTDLGVEHAARAANSRGPGGPTGPLGSPSRTPWILSR